MSFTPPSLTFFQLRFMVAQVPPTAARLVPRHSQDAPKTLGTSNHPAGRVQGQLQMLRAWSEEKHSIITECLSEGAFTSLILLLWCKAAAQQETCHCRQCQAQGMEGVSAQHHGGSAHLCQNLIWDHFKTTFSPHPNGEWEPHTLVSTVPDSYCTAGPGRTILQFPLIFNVK